MKAKKKTRSVSCADKVRREEGRLLQMKASLHSMLSAWKSAKDIGDKRDAQYWHDKLRSTVDEIEERKLAISDLRRNCRRA